jgi:hypothetical protein
MLEAFDNGFIGMKLAFLDALINFDNVLPDNTSRATV